MLHTFKAKCLWVNRVSEVSHRHCLREVLAQDQFPFVDDDDGLRLNGLLVKSVNALEVAEGTHTGQWGPIARSDFALGTNLRAGA